MDFLYVAGQAGYQKGRGLSLLVAMLLYQKVL